MPLEPDSEYVERIAATMPPLPSDRRARVKAIAADAAIGAVAIAVSRGLDELAIAAIEAGGDPGRVLTHIEHNLAVEGAAALEPSSLAALTRLEADGALTATQAKAVLAEMVENGGDPEAIAKAKGFKAMEASALDASVDDAIAAEPELWAKFVSGDDKAVGRLVGSVMKATKGQADGKAVTAKLMGRRAAAGR